MLKESPATNHSAASIAWPVCALIVVLCAIFGMIITIIVIEQHTQSALVFRNHVYYNETEEHTQAIQIEIDKLRLWFREWQIRENAIEPSSSARAQLPVTPEVRISRAVKDINIFAAKIYHLHDLYGSHQFDTGISRLANELHATDVSFQTMHESGHYAVDCVDTATVNLTIAAHQLQMLHKGGYSKAIKAADARKHRHSLIIEVLLTLFAVIGLAAIFWTLQKVRGVLARQRDAENALRNSEEKYRVLMDDASDAILLCDAEGRIIEANNAAAELFGRSKEDLLTMDFTDMHSMQSNADALIVFQNAFKTGSGKLSELWITLEGQQQVVVDMTASVVEFSGKRALLGIFRDITYHKQMQEALEQAALADSLTGLPNRTLFTDHLDQAIARSKRDDSRFAMLFFDFDRFKVVNDSLGHDVGDALLCDIADIFRGELRESDTVARFGGDEFVVLLEGLTQWSDAQDKAKHLLDVFAEPHLLGEHRVVSTASIGLVTNEKSYDTSADMIRDADAAMYQAKEAGKGRVVLFDQAMHEQAMDRLSLEADLRFAVAQEQLRLVYQPIVDLETGEISGFEALVRWEHPKRGTISPLDFIPIAEDTGLIIPIGQWVLRAAAKQIADWNQRLCLKPRLSMNVNISKRQLLSSSLIEDVLGCLKNFKLSKDELKLEITESTIADGRSDVLPILQQLRENGLCIAMDDFGTGLSSLGTLHEYPIDILKIDQSFIRSLDKDRSLLAVVASITTLAENLGITTVAEGIETQETIAALQSINCTWGQGYYFAKPMAPAEAEAYLLGIFDKKQGA